MLKSSLLELLAMRVGNRTDADLQAVLELEITLAQDTTLEQNGRMKPWFLVSEQATAVLTPNEQRLPQPVDFLGEVEEGALYVLNPASSKYVELKRDDFDFLDAKYKDNAPGLPKQYSLEGYRYYRLFPTPDQTYTVRQRFYERDTAFNLVASGAENRWLRFASDLLLAAGGWQFASKHLQNAQMATGFAGDITAAWARLKGENEMRKHTNRDYEMGD